MNNTLHTEAGTTAAHEHSRMAVAPIQTGSPDYMDKSLFTYRGVVYPWHLDSMDQMNVQHYTAAFDQSSWVLLATLGLDAQYFRANRRGTGAGSARVELHPGEEQTNDDTIDGCVIEIATQGAVNARDGLCQDRFSWHTISILKEPVTAK